MAKRRRRNPTDPVSLIAIGALAYAGYRVATCKLQIPGLAFNCPKEATKDKPDNKKKPDPVTYPATPSLTIKDIRVCDAGKFSAVGRTTVHYAGPEIHVTLFAAVSALDAAAGTQGAFIGSDSPSGWIGPTNGQDYYFDWNIPINGDDVVSRVPLVFTFFNVDCEATNIDTGDTLDSKTLYKAFSLDALSATHPTRRC